MWVTGYVLSQVWPFLPMVQRRGATAFLRGAGSGSRGWGFNARVVPDCDTTSVVTSALSPQRVLVQDDLEFVLRHAVPGQGFATYSDAESLRKYRGSSTEADFGGWMLSHECVTAQVLALLERAQDSARVSQVRTSARTWLVNRQTDSGLWRAYWWDSELYVAARIVPILRLSESPTDRAAAARATAAIHGLSSVDGWWGRHEQPCLLSTCWALAALDATSNDDSARAVRWLLSKQESDGRWTSTPCLRIPQPDCRSPAHARFEMGGRGVGSIGAGEYSVYSTATVLGFLSRL